MSLTSVNNNFFKFLLKLSNDEWYLILNNLKIGEIIILAITCKDFYNKITIVLQQYHPTYISFAPEDDFNDNIFKDVVKTEPTWSIKNSLRTFNKIIVNDETLPQLFKLFDKDLSKITKLYEISNQDCDCSLDSVIKLFSTENEKKRKIDVIDLNLQNLADTVIYNNKYTITVNDKTGYYIKKLTVFNQSYLSEFYLLLSQFYLLESLEIYFSVNDEILAFKSISVPIMYNLKHLTFDIEYFEYTSNKIVKDIIQMAPNLELIKFGMYSNVNDELLYFIGKYCPKLKSFDISRIDDRATITDYGLLKFFKEVPNLTYLDLSFCVNLSGTFYKEIGKYCKNLKVLKHFGVPGNNIYFGGGELLNLEKLNFTGSTDTYTKEFIESIFKTAPNIRKIKLLHKFFKTFDKFNFENLQSIDINQSEIERVFGTSVKNLTIRLNGDEKLSITKETLYNLLKYCPNLEKLNYANSDALNHVPLIPETKEGLIEILRDSKNWPNLKFCRISKGLEEEDLFENKIVNIRPSLKIHSYVLEQNSLKKQSEMEFARLWLMDSVG
ncbi:hypothetical protein ABK040_001826 [Willaertia magna]